MYPRLIVQGGRQLLLDAALEAIKIAEDPATEGNRVLMARSFHTATVYLEVLSSFNAVSPGACVLEIGETLVRTRFRLSLPCGRRHHPETPLFHFSLLERYTSSRMLTTASSGNSFAPYCSWSCSCGCSLTPLSRACHDTISRTTCCVLSVVPPCCLRPCVSCGVSEQERQLKYTKWRTYQCSHLLENIKHEFLDAESRVDDHYFLENVSYIFTYKLKSSEP